MGPHAHHRDIPWDPIHAKGTSIDTIDYIHGIGNALYIRVCPPMHMLFIIIWQLKSDLHTPFAFILAPETLKASVS
jgi:hypothetical protein